MKRSEISIKKRKISAAAIAAAAFAIVWILLEVAFFVAEIPKGDEMRGIDYSTYESETGVYTVTRAVAVRYSSDMGRIDNVSFIAQAVSPEEYNSKPVTVKVKWYDPSSPTALMTFEAQSIAIGETEAYRTVIDLEIPEGAGDVLIEFGYSDCDYRVGEITFNYKSGASFNFLRTAVVLGVILIAYLCARYNLWHTYFDPKKHRGAAILLCAVCVTVAILLSCILIGSEITADYPLASGIKYADPYEQQFDALMKGQLAIDVEPSDELLSLENPYDYYAREDIEADYLWDRAYYDGSYYSYFGMAPLFTVYFPFYFVTGSLPTANTVAAIFAVMTALFFSLAAVKWASMYTKKLPLPMLFLGVISALFSTQIFLAMRGRTKFYYIATVAGMAFLSLFIWLLLSGISGSTRLSPREAEPKKWKRLTLYALSGVAFGLLFMSRVNIAILAACVVLPMLWFRVLRDGNRFRKLKDFAPELLALGIPVVAFVGTQLVLNYLRFDSLFEFGSTYQLTVSDISYNKLRLSDLPAAIYHYFLQPVSYSTDFPMVSLEYTKLAAYGHYTYVDTGMGIFAIPIMWSLLGGAFVLSDKKRETAHKVTLLSVMVGSVAVALFDFCLGGVIFRYTCDLTLLLSFASMAVIFALCEETSSGSERVARGGRFIILTVLIASLLVSLSLSMSLEDNLTVYSPKAYVAFKELFTFG